MNRKIPAGTDLRGARSKKKLLLGENERRVDFDRGRTEWMTFHSWGCRYLELAAGKKTIRDDELLLQFLNVEFGPLPLANITYARIKEFGLKLRKTPCRRNPERLQSPATCNRKLALLRHILRMAWKEGILEKLPAVELFREDNERDRVLTEEEYAGLYEQAAEHLKPILLCAWETGMRKGEILRLTWTRVDLRNDIITLLSDDTKTSRKRLVPISDILREIFLDLRRERRKVTEIYQHVFLSLRGVPFKSIQTSFNNAVARAGLEDVHFHDVRRSFVTRKVGEGWDRDYIKAITGHRTDKVFARYNKPSLEALKNVVNGPRPTSVGQSVGKLLANGSGR